MTFKRNEISALPLSNNDLWLLGDSVDIDDRISWRAPHTRGRKEPINVYLLKNGDDHLLVEAGVTINGPAVTRQLKQLLPADPHIDRLAVTRNEPDTISNIPTLVQEFRLKQVYTPGVFNPLDFFDDVSANLQMLSFGVKQIPARPGDRIHIGENRWLEPIQTPLRMLSTTWYYDTGTRALFCSDIFSEGTHAIGEPPLTTDVGDYETLAFEMTRHLLQKNDWLSFSNLTGIIDGLEELFSSRHIDILAPSRGCVILGRETVKAHIAVLLDVLRKIGRNKPRKPAETISTPALILPKDESVDTKNRMIYSGFNTRDLGGGVHLLGGCFHASMYGRNFHSHASAYLVEGKTGAALVDTGHSKDGDSIAAFIHDRVGLDLSYIFPTHEEYPHAGNLPGLMEAFPDAQVVGDIRNYHLYYPEAYASGRFRAMKQGDRIDLGGRHLEILPAVIHDLPNSYWAWDDKTRMMFVADAFAFSHYEDSECTLFSEELPTPPTIDDTRQVLDLALYWTRFAEKQKLIDEMHQLFLDYPTAMIAPAHGNVVTKPDQLAKLMDEALLATTR